MLSLSALSGGREEYYLSLAREDYYVTGGEAPGYWLGRGSAAMGLAGDVQGDALRNLFRGLSPDGEHSLVQERKKTQQHQMGWDLTFSAPKSASVLWSQVGEKERARIQEIHRQAVASTLRYVEEHVAYTRRGQGGKVHERVGLVLAAFPHQTSRSRDPLIHTHVLVTNVGVREDGTTGSIVSKPFYKMKMLLGAMYRSEFARLLTADFGVTWEVHRTWLEISGVPRAIINHFSKRRQQILAALDARGLSGPVASAVAALDTRNKKDTTPTPRSELFREWAAEGRKAGWGPAQAKALVREGAQALARARAKGPGLPSLEPEEVDWLKSQWDSSPWSQSARPTKQNIEKFAREELVAEDHIHGDLGPVVPAHLRQPEAETEGGPWVAAGPLAPARPLGWFRRNLLEWRVSRAMDWITSSNNYFTERELLRRTIETTFGRGYTWEHTLDGVRSFLAERKEVVLLGETPDGVAYTSREVLECERKLLDLADESRREWTETLPLWSVRSSINAFERDMQRENPDFRLSEEQRRAIEHITVEPGSIKLIRGFAGTGKTSILKAARAVWEAHGCKVHGAAIAGAAAKRLQAETGIETGTVASRVWHLTRGHIDHEWEQLGRALRRQGRIDFKDRYWTLDSKSILVVDEASMVGTQDMLTLMACARKAGAKLVPIGDNRQLQAIERGGAFAALGEQLGYAELTEIRRQRDEWARDAVRAMVTGKADTVLAAYAEHDQFTVTQDREDALYALMEQWRGDGVENPAEHLIIASLRKETAFLNERAQEMRKRAGLIRGAGIMVNGQRIHLGDRVLFTRKSKLFGVENGDLGRVTLVSQLTQNVRVRLDDGKTVTIPLLRYNHLQLGYAMTAHKAQGATIENAYVILGGSMQDRELSYLEVSRARGDTRLFAEGAKQEWQLRSLVKAMNRSREKQFATRVAERGAREQEEPLAEREQRQARTEEQRQVHEQHTEQKPAEQQQERGPRLRL